MDEQIVSSMTVTAREHECVVDKAQEKCDDDLMLTLVLLVLVELDIQSTWVSASARALLSRPRIQANIITCYDFITFLLFLPLLILPLLFLPFQIFLFC